MSKTDKAEILYTLLKKYKITISTAESCTGGMISALLTDISGISEFFIEGIVTYSNDSKIERLGVKKETLQQFGAVSEEVVREMVLGLKTKAGIAVSGIAGPSGGTEQKPVGTVFIGVKLSDIIKVNKYSFSGSREDIRKKSTDEAVDLMIELIKEKSDIN